MFKKSDENRVLSGTSNVIQRAVASLVYCVRGCLKLVWCLSINYKRSSIGNEANCELLDINKLNSSAIVLDKPAWNIYEPVIQVFILLFHSNISLIMKLQEKDTMFRSCLLIQKSQFCGSFNGMKRLTCIGIKPSLHLQKADEVE